MRILVVDDDEITSDAMCNILMRAGHDVSTARDGREALSLLHRGLFRVVVSDWVMPEMDGIELCRAIRERQSAGYIYIILVTGKGGATDVVRGLDAGADDFLTKPVRPAELCVRVRAAERVLALEGRDVTILALAKLAESRDSDTGEHLERVREFCRVIAVELARRPQYKHLINADFIQSIYLTSPLHDIGKVGIPDSILLKPGRLDDSEFEIMKRHAAIGAETLDAAFQTHPEAAFLRMARDIALTHHERFDGMGYPHGLAGEDIPLCGRIVALADVYDALSTKRVYKPEMSHSATRSIIVESSGTHFDPVVVEAFLANEQTFVTIREELNDQSADRKIVGPALSARPLPTATSVLPQQLVTNG